LNQHFTKISSEIKLLQNDIENLDSCSNPLFESMQRHSANLYAIWDLWELVQTNPGDLGIMIPGDDPKRPQFKKILNVAADIHESLGEQGQTVPVMTSYPEWAEQQYIPTNAELWSSEVVDGSTIRRAFIEK
jgi:hypothetical protein